MKRTIVIVKWRDANGDPNYLYDGDVERYDALAVFVSSGLLVAHNKSEIIMAQDRDDKTGAWRGIYSIPNENIIKKKLIKLDV